MNTSRYIGSAVGAAVFLFGAGLALAQTDSMSASFNSNITTPSGGSQAVALGTVTLGAQGEGPFTVASLPLTLQTYNGASAKDLSNCQLMNGTGVSLNADHIPTIAQAGTPTIFVFDAPLSLSNSVDTQLTLECDVAPSIASNATYLFEVGAPSATVPTNLSTASTNTSTASTVSREGETTALLTVAPSVPAGSQNVSLATLSIAGAANTATTLNSIPVAIQYEGGASLTNCSIQNADALGVPLSSIVTPVTSPTTFTLISPVNVPANTVQRYALVCSVGTAAPQGSRITLSVDPAIVGAGSSDSLTGTVSITAPVTGNGAGAESGIGSNGGSIPGIPNTGVGGDALATLLILALSLFAAFIGATVTRKMKETETKAHA
jgi:hypothetical protein